jgi:hypothetical protein
MKKQQPTYFKWLINISDQDIQEFEGFWVNIQTDAIDVTSYRIFSEIYGTALLF